VSYHCSNVHVITKDKTNIIPFYLCHKKLNIHLGSPKSFNFIKGARREIRFVTMLLCRLGNKSVQKTWSDLNRSQEGANAKYPSGLRIVPQCSKFWRAVSSRAGAMFACSCRKLNPADTSPRSKTRYEHNQVPLFSFPNVTFLLWNLALSPKTPWSPIRFWDVVDPILCSKSDHRWR
jgi:hypothetical protein